MRDQLIKKADRLLKLKAVRDVYEIILHLGEGLEIEEMAAACDRGPELNLPDAKTKIHLEDYSKELVDKTYQQILEAMEKTLELQKEIAPL